MSGLLRAERVHLTGLLTRPWAITEDVADALLDIYHGHGEEPEALAARLGRPLTGAARTWTRDGVAVLPVHGPIVKHGGPIADASGLTSTVGLRQDLEQAMASPDVTGILLDVDSPGGQADGISELAQAIRAASATKPVAAYVGSKAASAAYWLAAAAPRVVAHESASLGSIGVILTVLERAQPGEKRFVSTVSPLKRPDLGTDEGRAAVQSYVDQLAGLFIEQVADWRGVSVETVAEQFGRGWVVTGRQAKAVGMVDELSNFEAVLASMTKAGGMGRPAATRGMTLDKSPAPAASSPDLSALTIDQLTAGNPGLVEQIRALGHRAGLEEGRKAGADGERARILGIEENALAGHEALVAECKRDPSCSPEAAAVKVLRAERERGPDHVARLRAQEDRQPKVATAATATEAGARPAIDPALPFAERCKAQWDRDPALRTEFESLDAFMAYEQAQTRGLVRITGRDAA